MLKEKEINHSNINNNKIITFIGMMGTGKSKFGRLIARNLKIFMDKFLIKIDQNRSI